MPLNTSPIKVQTKIPDIGKLDKELKRRFRAFMREAHLEATDKAKEILKDSISRIGFLSPVRLIKSVSARFVKDASINGFSSNVGFRKPGSNYAYFANYGSSPSSTHDFVSIKALSSWARAKGIDQKIVYNLSKKIAREGTKGKDFMADARPKIEKSFDSILKKKVSEFNRSLK